jgi:hypothetical protein
MSRLVRTTHCTGKVGSCHAHLARSAVVSHSNPTLQQLETRLYQIHRELHQLHSQDVQRAHQLQQDAETTAATYRSVNRGELSINITHILNRINDLVKSGFGKLGEFFTHLAQRQATVEPETPLEVQAALDASEKRRILGTVRFRKVLPTL